MVLVIVIHRGIRILLHPSAEQRGTLGHVCSGFRCLLIMSPAIRGDVAEEPQTIDVGQDSEGYFYYCRLYDALPGPLGSQDEVVRYLDRLTLVGRRNTLWQSELELVRSALSRG